MSRAPSPTGQAVGRPDGVSRISQSRPSRSSRRRSRSRPRRCSPSAPRAPESPATVPWHRRNSAEPSRSTSVNGARISPARGPWTASSAGRERPVVEDRPEALESLDQRVRDDRARSPAFATTRNRSSAEPVDDEVVDDAAVRRADHRVVGPPDGEGRRVADQCRGQGCACLGALDVQLAHVRQIEQAGPAPNSTMLLEDRAVLDRHEPATELDQTRTERDDARPRAAFRRSCGRAVVRHVGASSAVAQRRAWRRAPRARERPRPLWPPGPARSRRSAAPAPRRSGSSGPPRTRGHAREVAAGRFHEVVVDRFMDPPPRLDEPVLDRVEGSVIRTSSPVSSATSRNAVCSRVSPAVGVPLGSVQVRLSRSRRRLPTTSDGPSESNRTTTPPAEVAVADLRRATAPTRRRIDVPSQCGRTGTTP